jgi:hypothetical protein
MTALDLTRLSVSDIRHLQVSAGLSARRLEDPFAAALFARLLAVADDEEARRLTQQPRMAQPFELPIDEDADPAVTAQSLGLAIRMVTQMRGGYATPLTTVYGEVLAILAVARDARQQATGAVVDLYTGPAAPEAVYDDDGAA